MKRRLRIAATAFGAFLVPACVTPPEPRIPSPKVTSPTAVKPAPGSGANSALTAKLPRTSEKFADGRTETTSAFAQATTPKAESPIAATPVAKPDTPPIVTVAAESVAQPISMAPRSTGVATPTARETAKPDPVPDAEGVIRANWPILKAPTPVAQPTTPTPPLSGAIAPVKADETPTISAPPPTPAPPVLPPGVIGMSQHQSNASPVDTSSMPMTGTETPSTVVPMSRSTNSDDTPLLRAVRAFQQNRPDDAVEQLKMCDPAAQQAVLSLVPALVRLCDGKVQQIKPEEMDIIVEQLNRVPNMLRSRASLQANNVRLCREVHNFGHVEPFPNGHQFRPGDIVYLYMELANFTCTADPKVGFAIAMASELEIRDAAGKVVWRADPKEIPDTVSSPPQDYYRNFRLCVPNLPPGVYTLSVKTIDRPTAREVTKTVELRIGAR